jgi:hypothetical protein
MLKVKAEEAGRRITRTKDLRMIRYALRHW